MDCHGIRPTDTIFVYVDGSEQHEPGTVFKHYHFVINMYFDRFAYHYVLLVGRAKSRRPPCEVCAMVFFRSCKLWLHLQECASLLMVDPLFVYRLEAVL